LLPAVCINSSSGVESTQLNTGRDKERRRGSGLALPSRSATGSAWGNAVSSPVKSGADSPLAANDFSSDVSSRTCSHPRGASMTKSNVFGRGLVFGPLSLSVALNTKSVITSLDFSALFLTANETAPVA